MTIAVILLFGGLLLLYYGANYLVIGSSRLASSFGVRPLIIGMTIVAFATSMPELMVSLLAAIKGSSDIATGNIIGSNIANIGLVLGVAALLSPMAVARTTLSREIPFMIVASVLLFLFALDGVLDFINGLILFLLLLGFLAYCLHNAREREFDPQMSDETPEPGSKTHNKAFLYIIIGIAGLGFGAELMVRSAVTIAQAMGISELIIGMSIVALGTSLPELAASVVSACKGEMDISVGNVIGSNIFNILFVMGVCPMIRALPVEPSVLTFQLPIMLLFSGALIPLVYHRMLLSRAKGGLLLGAYLLFVVVLYL